MLIISCCGGLGNQMFQYAFYFKLKTLQKKVKFDISYFDKNFNHNGFELERLFNLQIEKSFKCESLFFKLLRKIGLKSYAFFQNNPRDVIKFHSEFYILNNILLAGYWQSYKYFEDLEVEIRRIFTFKIKLDARNENLLKSINKYNSVSIHVRRGDYLKPENKIFQNICTIIYYKNAIQYIEKHVNDPYYFIFSNDIQWCKQNINLKNVTYVNWNIGKESYKDMQLMSYCKHNIIANSSFSWWGAWLNNNPNKIVCVPEKWFDLPECETKDICPDEWIRIQIQ